MTRVSIFGLAFCDYCTNLIGIIRQLLTTLSRSLITDWTICDYTKWYSAASVSDTFVRAMEMEVRRFCTLLEISNRARMLASFFNAICSLFESFLLYNMIWTMPQPGRIAVTWAPYLNQSDDVERKLNWTAASLLLVLLDEYYEAEFVPCFARFSFRCSTETDNVLANFSRSNCHYSRCWMSSKLAILVGRFVAFLADSEHPCRCILWLFSLVLNTHADDGRDGHA